jgi:hypothetical protein
MGCEYHVRQTLDCIQEKPKTNISARKADAHDYEMPADPVAATGDGVTSILSRDQDVLDRPQGTREREHFEQVSPALFNNAADSLPCQGAHHEGLI